MIPNIFFGEILNIKNSHTEVFQNFLNGIFVAQLRESNP